MTELASLEKKPRTFGLNQIVFERSLEKLLISLESGKGGFPTLIWWLDNADYVDDISELVNSMSRNHTFYDTAIVKCSKEALARPEKVREEEIAMLLDNVCLKCGRVFPMMGNTPRRCPSCGGDIDSKYVQITEQLVDLDVAPTPEAVFMAAAYDCLAQAYIDGFIALKRVFSVVRSELHLDSNFQFINEKLKDKLDSIFYYYEAGDVRFAKEERCLLMVLVRATLADLKIARIEDLCRVACDVLKFGHLHNKFYCSGALAQYDNKRVEYSRLYNSINEEIRTTTVIPREKRKQRSVTYLEIRDYKKEIIYPYYATALLPDEFWIRGRLSNNLIYQPLTDIPYLGSPSDAGVTFVSGPSGKGKTTVMSDIIGEVVDRDKCVVLDVLGDDANSLKLASLPMFWRKREITQSKKFVEILERMNVRPHGVPCVPPNTLVETDSGLLPIGDVKKGFKVLSHDGYYRLVTQTYIRDYEGDIVYVKPGGYRVPIQLTPEHPVLAIKTQKCSIKKNAKNGCVCKSSCQLRKYYHHNGRRKNKRKPHNEDTPCQCLEYYENYKADWIPASELKKGDLLLYPRYKVTEDKEFLKLSDYIPNAKVIGDKINIKKEIWINNQVPVNEDFMRLCGYYLSEGFPLSITGPNGRYLVDFAFHAKEQEYIADVQALVKKFFNLTGKVRKRVNSAEIVFGSKGFQTFIVNLLGKGSRNKKLPLWIINLPEDKLCGLITGLWRGDGSNKVESCFTYTTYSLQLADQIKMILAKIGVPCSIAETSNRASEWRISVFGLYMKHFSNICGMEHVHIENRDKSWSKCMVDENYIYLPILNVEKLPYKGTVHNLEVDQSHSYVLQSLTAHNCINLTFLRRGERISEEDIEANPPTIWDYIVMIKSPSSFGLKFDTPISYKQSPGILNLLRTKALMMGYPDIRGIINVMNLDRIEGEGKDKSKPDNLISAEVMSKFCRWRLNNKSFDMMLFADEVSNLAPVQFDSGTGADTSVSSASLAQTIKKVRKRRTSWLLGSQKFSEVNPNVRAEANYVMFRELPQAQDKARSQTDIVLEALQLKAGDGFKKMIRGMIEEGAFPEKEFIWFKHDKNARDLQVIKPNVPYFMLYQRDLTMREVFRAYEKWMADLKESDNKEDRALFEYYAMTVGEKVLLKSWRDVPILEYPDDTFKS